MKKIDDLDQWLRETAQSAEMNEAVRVAEPAQLPEELLLRYHAGLLTPEQEKAVAHLIALNEKNLRFLAGVEDDIRAAAAQTAPKMGLAARLADWFSSVGAFWKSPRHALRFAGAIAILVVAVLLGIPPDRPPGELGPPYPSPLLERVKGTQPGTMSITLPDGTELGRIDPDWPLHEPIGDVEQPTWFTWRPLLSKSAYNYRLYSQSGAVLHEARDFSNSYIKLPGSVRRSLEVGTEYVWVVESAGDDDLAVIRGVGRFRIVRR